MNEETGLKPVTASETVAIPLNLAPLLSRFKGNISLRIERMPHRARLSDGHNNGDHSWSVSLGELKDLVYLLPAEMREPHTLAIRVINREGSDGTTVAVIDYSIAPSDSSSAPDVIDTPGGTAAPLADFELRGLRQELNKAKVELAARDAALAESRQQSEQDWAAKSRQLVDNALNQARTDWDTEFAKRLSAVSDRAESMLESRRRAWQAELDARLLEAEKRAHEHNVQARERWQREADAALASAQEVWKSGEASRLATLEARWQRDAAAARTVAQADAARQQSDRAELARLRGELTNASAALGTAQELWKTGEAARLAAAEARWRQETATALAEARSEAARNAGDRAELKRLRDQLAAAQRSLAGSELELTQVRADAERAQQGWRQGTEAAIARAKQGWKTEEDARLSAAETRWRERLTEVTAKLERAEAAHSKTRPASDPAASQRDQAELRRLGEELAMVRVALAKRDAELAQARDQWQQDSAAKFALAREEWKAEEGVRLVAAETRWREQLGELATRQERTEAELLKARAEPRSPLAGRDDGELASLRNEIETMRATLAARESAFVQAREEWEKRSEAKFAQAKDEWLAAQAVKLAEAETRGRQQSAQALQSAAERCARAEAELSELRERPLAESEPNDRVTILRLRDELEKFKINLELRDIELRQARSAAAEALGRWKGELDSADQHIQIGRPTRHTRANKANGEEKPMRPLLRDVAIVAGLAALATVLFPSALSLVPEGWLPQFGPAVVATEPVHAKPRRPPPVPPAVALPQSVVLRAAKVHADPSAAGAVLATLPRDMNVGVLEQNGNWVRVSFVAVAGQPKQQGWVYGPFLKSVSASVAAPAAAR